MESPAFPCQDVFLVIPSYNEGKVLASTLESVLPSGYSVVVADDGSRDDTAAIVARYPVHYLRHPVNLGQGAALETGTKYALGRGARIVIHFDADGQHPADRLAALIAPIESGDCDLAIGSRFLETEAIRNVPPSRRWLLRGAILVSGLLTHVWLSDAHNGLRALSREAAEKIRIRENGPAHATEIIELARKQNLRIQEIPVTIRYTEYSRQKGQRATDSLNILVDLMLRKVL